MTSPKFFFKVRCHAPNAQASQQEVPHHGVGKLKVTTAHTLQNKKLT